MTNSRVFLIHGWSGSPAGDWMPWATKELISRGYEAIVPLMPDTDHPVIDAWVDYLSELVGTLRPDDIFIGHSIGCQTILRYLETVDVQAAKVILVAPSFTLSNLESDEMWTVADPWLKTPMNFTRIIPKAKQFVTIFSDNDPWVPYAENSRLFRDRLSPEIITLHNQGHLTADEGVIALPELLSTL